MGGQKRILVFHPGRQHSERSARALEAAGMLAAYWTGVPGPALAGYTCEILVRPIAPVLRRLAGLANPAHGALWGDYFGSRLFDSWAARRIVRLRPDAVIGYEVGCARTFAIARQTGCACILDAASLHHRRQTEWAASVAPPALARRVVAVKDREIALADRILVGSSLAAESYNGAGVPSARISIAPLGVDLERFKPGATSEEQGFAVLFVGKMSPIKGVDLLLEAFRQLLPVVRGTSLRIAGQGSWGERLPEGVVATAVKHDELPEVYRSSDLLVLPSRLDGFGLVVAEALACGTPVLVSDHVGAKDLVEEGSNGWVFPSGDVGALCERLRWCGEHLDQVRAMRAACRNSVESFGWDAYGRRLLEVMCTVLAGGEA